MLTRLEVKGQRSEVKMTRGFNDAVHAGVWVCTSTGLLHLLVSSKHLWRMIILRPLVVMGV